ncbi:MAG: diguanylate cyclase [Comamonadaceae bacterium]|nr:MAG: diguanylate cyclase [Comamonadaceae bacterium]
MALTAAAGKGAAPSHTYSFRNQLTLWFGGLSLVALLGGGLYVGHIATQEIASSGGESLYISARSAADLLATNLRERDQEIDLLRQSPLLLQGDLSSDAVRQALDARKKAHNEYAWIGVTTPEGVITQATDGVLVGEKVSQRPWFKAALSGTFVGDVHEAVLLAKRLPNTRPDQPLRFIDFAAPIVDAQGQLRGVLGAHAHWSWVTDTVESVVTGRTALRRAEVLIADKNGQILYPFRYAGVLQLPPQASAQVHYASLAWGDGQDYLTTMVQVESPGGADLGWRVVLRQPAQVAQAPVRALRNQLLLLGLITAALCALLAHRLASRVSRPLELLARAARQIERREGTPHYPQGRHAAEIDQLNQSFQSMTQSLLQREQQLSQLNASLEGLVAERTQALHRANLELESLAARDALTGLYNRRRFDDTLQELFQRSQRTGHRFALMVIDADHFKRVNDTFGHPAGDAVLQQLAHLIAGNVRVTDFVARYGGEEFVVLLPEPQDEQDARLVAEKLRAAVSAHDFGAIGPITVSVGLSSSHAADAQASDIVARADKALYEAKQQGRNRTVIRHANVDLDTGAD